jgi:ABC-type branched-subunit amino acid transport system substrate-binding protein
MRLRLYYRRDLVKRPRLSLAAVVAALVLAAGLAACGDDDDNGGGGGGGKASFDLTIGDSVPLSGDLADFGPPGDKAAKLALSQINTAIKQAGADQTVKLVTQDNETNPQAAVSAARKMVSDGASCIAGAWASADTIPTSRSVAIPEGVLLISPASTSDEITGLEDNGLVNRTSPPDRFQGPTLANFMDEELGGAKGTTISTGGRNDSYGEGLTGTFSDAWTGLGGKLTSTSPVLYDPEQATYDSEAQQITSGNPDGFVIVDFSDTFPKVGPALERTGNWDPTKAFFTDGLASSDMVDAIDASIIEGLRGTAPGSPDSGSQAAAWDKLYTSFKPTNVGRLTFDTQNFDAVMLCYLTAVAAGSTDGQDMADQIQNVSGPPGKKFSWQQLPEAIKALQNGDDIDYQGASGPLDINKDGDATAGVYDTFEWQNGKLETIGEIPVALPGG